MLNSTVGINSLNMTYKQALNTLNRTIYGIENTTTTPPDKPDLYIIALDKFVYTSMMRDLKNVLAYLYEHAPTSN